MKQILKLILLLVIGQTALAQAPSNYVNINGRYRWIAGMFDSTFHIPKGTSPSLRTGGSTNAGALFYRTSDSTVRYWTGSQWLTLSDTTRFVPYVGATKDVDLDTWSLIAKSLHIKGTAGQGHLGLKFQSATPNMSANESGVYADANGNLGVKIDNAYTSIFKTNLNSADRTYTFQNKSYTIGDSSDIEARVKYTDTTSMLSPYLRKADTTAMLNPYFRLAGVGLKNTGQTVYADTLLLSTRAWRQKGVDSVASLITGGYVPNSRTITINGTSQDLSANRSYSVGTVTSVGITAGTGISVANSPVTGSGNITVTNTAPDQTVSLTAGTGISVSGTYPSFTITNSSPSSGGTVTSIATNNGTGITGGTIVSTGTLAIDTLLLSTRAWRQKGIDSVAALINSNVSGTTNYIPKFTSSSAIGNSVIYESGGNIGIGTIVPEELLELSSSNTTGGQLLIESTGLTAGNYAGMRFKIAGGSNGGYEKAGIFAIRGSGGFNDLSLIFATNTAADATNVTSANEKMRLDASGNLGIGTSSPASRLDVNGAISLGAVAIPSAGVARLYSRNTDNNLYIQTSTGNNIYLLDGSQNSMYAVSPTSHSWLISNSTRMTLDASGNLGLGTSSPAGQSSDNRVLQIVGAGTGTRAQLKLTNATSGNTGTDGLMVSFDDQLDAYLYNFENGKLIFGTNNAVRATLDASGNLGLGVTPSASNLPTIESAYGLFTGQAESNIMSNAYYNSGFKYNQTGYATRYYQNSYQGSHIWYTAPSGTAGNAISFTQAMTLDASGRLGIGSTSPVARLTVVGASTVIGQTNVSARFSDDLNSTLLISHPSSTSGTATISGNEQLAFATGVANSLAERIRITSTGNVGIGTTSPTQKLDVNGKIRATDDLILAQTNPVIAYDNGTTGALRFASDGGNTERMRITSGGLVGIGTSSPDVKLTVDGATGGNSSVDLANFYASKGQTDASYLRIQGSRSATAGSRYIALDVFDGGATSRTLILNQSGGEVFIAGTTDQGAYNLQVNGTGVWGAGAYVNGSDSALKQNIQPLDNSLDLVKQMKPVTYTYKDSYSKDSSVQTGFIAQDLQLLLKDKKYLNGIVKQGSEFMSVAYQNIIPLLVKAIQELEAEIQILKNK